MRRSRTRPPSSPLRQFPRPLVIGIISLLVLAAMTWGILQMVLPHNLAASGKMFPLRLQGGVLEMPLFSPRATPQGIVILGTGCGGWSSWEETTAKHLAAKGLAVGGWDCRKFADTRTYDYEALCAGFLAAVEAVREGTGAAEDVPVWYAGWSTGAEQSVAAATAPDRPQHLAGLLLAAPGPRGRFGITAPDLLGQTPTGPGTFSLEEMGKRLRRLPVIQFSGGLDPLDDTKWLSTYEGPSLLFHFPELMHDLGGAGTAFQAKLEEAIHWTLTAR